ncbi:MAG: MucBP domain-containing protein, partial [Ruminococcus sp.]|nr:MucBP domain-containing protein [Ruminococcus sp.]
SLAGSSKTIAYTVDNTTEGEWNKVAVMFNGTNATTTQTLKTNVDKGISKETEWVIIANDKQAGIKKLGEVKGLSFKLAPFSTIIAVEKATYEACNFESEFSTVYINHVDSRTGEIFKTNTIMGKPGEGYIASADKAIPLKYEIDTIEGDTIGKFAETDTDVNYVYKNFVPDSLKAENGDITGDGYLTIVDATKVQRYLAHLDEFDDTTKAKADYNYDKDITIIDATLLQRFLASMDVSVYTLTVNYLDDNGESFIPSYTKEFRLGEEYVTEPKESVFYELTGMPENASGVISGNITVTYQYKYIVEGVKVHVKHNGDLTWDPFLWAWADPADGGGSVNLYDAWPGFQITDKDEEGWYTTELDVPPGYTYNIIINNGGGIQTSDYVGYSAPEIWVVIDDAQAIKNGTWITVYADKECTQELPSAK